MEVWRKERQDLEMAECTFKPEISNYRLKKVFLHSSYLRSCRIDGH